MAKLVRPRWAAVLLALVVLALYARAVGFGYVWDDLNYFGAFNYYQGLEGLRRAVTQPFLLSASYYRPLAVAGFALSGEAGVQHGVNVLLHMANTVLVFWCALALMPRETAASLLGQWAAALGALAFAIHPLVVEPVVWVSGRFDALMCSFVLATCLAALGGELTRRRLTQVCVLFFAAMCSKESAAGLFAALPFLLWLKYRLANVQVGRMVFTGALVRLLAALALALMLYVVVRAAVLGALFPKVVATFSSRSWVDKFNVAALALAEFAKLMVNPWSHSAPMHPLSYEAGSGMLANTFAVAACVLALLVLAVLKKPRLNVPLAFLAALGMLWPTLHFFGIPNGANLISDRYALAPLALLLAALTATAGVWLARCVPAMNVGGKREVAYATALCLLWLAALVAHTWVTVPLWRDEVSFWTFAYRQTPSSERANKGYIKVLGNQGRWDEARTELDSFWKKHPGTLHRLTIFDITTCMYVSAMSGDYKDALAWFELAESRKDKLAQVHGSELSVFYSVRGMIAANVGEWGDAVVYLEKSMGINDADKRIPFWYAHALFMTGQRKKSDDIFNKALANATRDVAAWAVEWRKEWGER